MKAILYNKKIPGKLIYTDVEKPVMNDDEVLIKVKASSINAADYRSMKMGLIPKRKIFGADVAGIVESVGKNISEFKPGDEVVGDLAGCGFGGFAEYTTAKEKYIIKKPEGISFEESAAIPLASVTALQGLRDKGKIKKGDEVLIVGSGGGVGTFAVQLAKYYETEVTAVCSERNIEQSRLLGADKVIDYKKDNILIDSKRYDMIFVINGSYSPFAIKKLLKENGRYVLAGGALSQLIKVMLFGWFLSIGSKKAMVLAAKPNRNDLDFIFKLFVEGKIKPVIEKSYPLNKTMDAMRYVSEGHAKGKIIITI